MVDRVRPRPAIVTILHHTEASRPLAGLLAKHLTKFGERPCVAGDDERWKPSGEAPFRSLVDRGQVIDAAERQRILKEWTSHGRLLVDVSVDLGVDHLAEVISFSEIVLWCVREQDSASAVDALRALQARVPALREKVRIVWTLPGFATVAPYVPEVMQYSARDFKVTFDPPGDKSNGGLLSNGSERIVHHLRGVQIGLALGGGAARGMAHLGVLKALEDNGIVVDIVAGTSAGAMTGTLYAGGVGPQRSIECFKHDLLPSWFFRQLPAGGYWYLLYKYRLNRFEPMLRKYLGHARMEQLLVPMVTMSVDLIEGTSLVRDTGDATVNILESINLPPLSLPLLSQGAGPGGWWTIE